MRDKVISYYESLRSHYSTYHNHKETSAWAGLILFLFFAGFVNLIKSPAGHEIATATTFTVLILIVLFLVFRYISNQLKMKDLSGAYVAASIAVIADLITDHIKDDELREHMKIEEFPDNQAQSHHVLPCKFIKRAETLNSRGRDFQDTTRHMIYSILTTVSMILISTKWWQAFI